MEIYPEDVPDNNSILTASSRIQSTLEPCVVLMKNLLAKYQHLYQGENKMYSLAQGVVYWNPPESASDAMISALKDQNNDLHQYSPDEGIPEFIAAFKKKLKRENNLPSSNATSIDVVITAGANQAYMNCVCTLLSEGDKCVVFKPYYFNHVMAVQMIRGNEALVIGTMDENGYPNLEWLRKQLEQKNNMIKMVTIVNPGNPSGVSMPTNYLRNAVDLCKEFHVWLILDCTYEHFDHTGINSFKINGSSELGFYCFDDDNVVNIFSFSKGYSLAGYRVGALTLNTSTIVGKDTYRQMLKVQDTIPICNSKLSQLAAMGALSIGRQWVHDKVKTLSPGRDFIIDALRQLDCYIGGTGAMYIMAKLPDGFDDMVFAETLIEKYGIAVIPGKFVGSPGWIRVCYSNLPPEDCKIAAQRLKRGIVDICDFKT